MKEKGKAIFVPFEHKPGQKTIKVDDLPRFDRIEDVVTYMQQQGGFFAHRKIAWTEHFDKWAQDEFERGVGTLRILL